MTYPKTESWRDDLDLEPNTHPTIAHALHAMRGAQRWPFPIQPSPPDKTPPPPPPTEEANA